MTIRRIGWIGTGVMGCPMAGHLLDAGYELRIFTRTKPKAQPLLDRGASWAESPAEACEGMDAAISMVGFPEDVEETHLGPRGTLASSSPPPIIVDMTTSRPQLAEEIAKKAASVGIGAVDAPVSGGDIGARNATLSIMVGAEQSHFDSLRPVFSKLGETIVLQGTAGAGQHTKMVNQILIASTMMGACEGLLYAEEAGLDPTRVLESVSSGAAGSWTISQLGPRIIARDFEPGFYVEHFLKDLRIAIEEANQLSLTLPGLALATRLYETLANQGGTRLGTQALYLSVRTANGLPQITAAI